MSVLNIKPTSPGRRGMVKIVYSDLCKFRKNKKLIEKQISKSGRNNKGRITVRHRGGCHKKHYRKIDFKRNDKDNILAKVESIEYDPNRSSNIALLCYLDGERRYIICPKGLKIGSFIISGDDVPLKVGNSLPIYNIPVGSNLHCLEIIPGKGAQIARSAGSYVILLSREGSYSQIRLRSGEIRLINIKCRATIGEVGNSEHGLRKMGKAGSIRWRGIRPTVRGVAMNPIDHPHGGGEGRTGEARNPVSPWGVLSKGYKTRKNKKKNNMIVQKRNSR